MKLLLPKMADLWEGCLIVPGLMTCGAGFSDGRTITRGADSAAAGATAHRGIDTVPYLIGGSGSYRVAQILRFRTELPERSTQGEEEHELPANDG